MRERESIVEVLPRERTYCAGEGEGERRYRERERTVRERESIVEAVPREDILRIAEPVAVPQNRGVLRERWV